MRIALDSLGLDKLVVAYPGDRRYELARRVEVVPLAQALGESPAEGGGAHWARVGPQEGQQLTPLGGGGSARVVDDGRCFGLGGGVSFHLYCRLVSPPRLLPVRAKCF
jgi:hypothetical protein